MNMRRTFVPVAALVFPLALLAVAAPSTLAEDVKVKLKVDETYRYKTDSTMITEVMGQEEEIDSSRIVAFSALSVKGGWTKLEGKIEEFEMDESAFMGGADLGFINDVVFSFEVDDRGQTREFKIDSGGDDDPMMFQILQGITRGTSSFGFMGVGLPKGSLSVGMMWSKEIDAVDMFGEGGIFQDLTGSLEIKYEITKFGTVDGKRMMTIASIMSGSVSMTMAISGLEIDASMEIDSQIVTLITVSDGLVYSIEAESTTLTDTDMFEMEQRGTSKTKRLMK